MNSKNKQNKALPTIRKQSLINRTTEMLTDHIMSGHFSFGDYLASEHELCGQLGIGRSTLREAVKVLESRGLVRRQHGVGVQVVDESRRAARELLKILFRRSRSAPADLLQARIVLDVQQAALAAERADDSDIERIQQALDRSRDSGLSRDAAVEADVDFHVAIAAATHNQVLLLIAEILRPFFADALREIPSDTTDPVRGRHYHEEIIWAIRKGHSRQAAEAMSRHLRGEEGAKRSAGS